MRQEQTGGWGLAGEMGLIFGSHYASGLEAKMVTQAATRTTMPHYLMSSKGLSNRLALGRTAGALDVARRYGAFNKAAVSAATKAGLVAPFSKIAMSRLGGLVWAGFQVSWFAPLIYSGVKGLVQTAHRYGKDRTGLEFGNQFTDTQGSYTARQRAVRAITSSRYAARAAIGAEAQLLHR